MFDFIFESVGEVVVEALFEGFSSAVSGSVLGLTGLNSPIAALDLTRRDDLSPDDEQRSPEAAK